MFIGNLEHKINNCKAIIFENLPEEEKFYVLQHCTIFVMPSKFESLNMACLEAWLFKKPILVNANSEVLYEHCLQSQGGLYFENYEEFSELLDLLLIDISLAERLGNNGMRYVKENYDWNTTLYKYEKLFNHFINTVKKH